MINMKKLTTDNIGDIAELEIMTFLKRNHHEIFTPINPKLKYDFVSEYENRFAKVQVKSVKIRNGCIKIPLCSSNGNPYSKRDVDYVYAYCVDNGDIFCIEINDFKPRKKITLRYENPICKQKQINYAEKFRVN